MVWCIVEVSCAPYGETSYPVPTSFRMVKVLASRAEATTEWTGDKLYRAETDAPEHTGQDVYYLLWNTSEPLNLDRHTVQDNSVSNVGSWLPETKRIESDVRDLHYELKPPRRVQMRAKDKREAHAAAPQYAIVTHGKGKKQKQSKVAAAPAPQELPEGVFEEDGQLYYEADDGEIYPYEPPKPAKRTGGASGQPRYGRRGGGTPWRNYF